jgi:hypothetical protein
MLGRCPFADAKAPLLLQVETTPIIFSIGVVIRLFRTKPYSVKIRVETESQFAERVSQAVMKERKFPHCETSVDRRKPAEMQMAGVFETLFIHIDPETFKMLFTAAAAVIGKEMVKDGYTWVKSLFQKNCEEHAKSTSKEKHGVEVYVWEDRPNHTEGVGSINVKYYDLPFERDAVRAPFSADRFSNEMRAFENVVLPTIAHWKERPGFRSFRVQGFIGPGQKEDPHWLLAIETDARVSIYQISGG